MILIFLISNKVSNSASSGDLPNPTYDHVFPALHARQKLSHFPISSPQRALVDSQRRGNPILEVFGSTTTAPRRLVSASRARLRDHRKSALPSLLCVTTGARE